MVIRPLYDQKRLCLTCNHSSVALAKAVWSFKAQNQTMKMSYQTCYILTFLSIFNRLVAIWKVDFSTPSLGLGKTWGSGQTRSIACPWVPVSYPMTHMVYLLPLLSHLAGSTSVPSARPTDPDTMTNTVLEAIASRAAITSKQSNRKKNCSYMYKSNHSFTWMANWNCLNWERGLVSDFDGHLSGCNVLLFYATSTDIGNLPYSPLANSSSIRNCKHNLMIRCGQSI